MNIPPKIYVAGHRGMVGSAIVCQLLNNGHPKEYIVTRTHDELDLINQAAFTLTALTPLRLGSAG